MKSGANYQDQNKIKECMRKGMNVEETSKFLNITGSCIESFYDHFKEEIGEVAELSPIEEQDIVSEEERSNFETEKLEFGVEKANFETQKSGFETERADFEAKKVAFEDAKIAHEETVTAFNAELENFELEKAALKEAAEEVLDDDLSSEESETGS